MLYSKRPLSDHVQGQGPALKKNLPFSNTDEKEGRFNALTARGHVNGGKEKRVRQSNTSSCFRAIKEKANRSLGGKDRSKRMGFSTGDH